MVSLRSVLPADRTQLGILQLVDDEGLTIWGPVPCLGKADNQGAADHGNPTRDPAQPYGDHPLGEYVITAWVPTAPTPDAARTYGAAGKLVLDPVSGPALTAKQHGRFALLIHGGAQGGPYSGFRPTFGCVRLKDEDMSQLVARYQADPFTQYVAEEA